MLNTSSSEDDVEGDVMSGDFRRQDLQSNLRPFDSKSLDLRSKMADCGPLRVQTAPTSARIPVDPKHQQLHTTSGGWQPLQLEPSNRIDQDRNKRAPQLGRLSTSKIVGQDNQAPTGDAPVDQCHFHQSQNRQQQHAEAPGTRSGSHFSVSFEGTSESVGTGVRMSPVGSSCWSSEHQPSPDLTSLMSSSTNSVSAGLSISSGRIPHGRHSTYVCAANIQPLQHQPSSGTGVGNSAVSIEVNKVSSTSRSVRSAPLCYASAARMRGLARAAHEAAGTPSQQDVSETAHPYPPSVVIIDSEENTHLKHLQIYMLAVRCVAYPILNPTSQGPTRRYLKMTKDYLSTLKERFQAFLHGEVSITCDEAFHNAISDFYEVVLKSDRIASMVKSGSCSMYDIREIFITNVEKRFQNQILEEGLVKESIINAWKIKFDQICRGGEQLCQKAMKLAVPQPEITNPLKEQLYELLMKTLGVEKYEHQILFNACQLDNADEQAAQIRRELSERLAVIDQMAKKDFTLPQTRPFPKLVHKEMESQYFDEERLRVNELINRLDSIPVLRSFAMTSSHGQRRLHKHRVLRHLLKVGTDSRTGKTQQGDIAGPHGSNGSRGGLINRPGSPLSNSLLCSESTTALSEPYPGSLRGHGIHRESIRLEFTLEVVVHQLRSLKQQSPSKKLYCTIESEGSTEKKRTESLASAKPIWNTAADFQTNQPLPAVKVKLYKECSSPLSIEDKELGRVIMTPTWMTTRTPAWYRLQTSKSCHDSLELQLSVNMQRPANCKYANFCWIQGRTAFKKWKRRYVCLTQVSQCTFVLVSYVEQRSLPVEFVTIDGFTVDYCECRPDLVLLATAAARSGGNTRTHMHHSGLSVSLTSLSKLRFGSLSRSAATSIPSQDLTSGLRDASGGADAGDCMPQFFFKLVREGDQIVVASSTEADRLAWVQAIYRATGQTHKPSLMNGPSSTGTLLGGCGYCPGSGSLRKSAELKPEDAHPMGIERLANGPVHPMDHLELFMELQKCTLNNRLQDSFISLGWFSPGQKIILDEYCARYGVRECQRHLVLLKILLDKAENGIQIDPDLIHVSYSLCANHVSGKTHHDQAVHTVLSTEREEFFAIRERLKILLEKQITEFRYCFPFGRPEGALEKTIGLLERVLAKEVGEPATADVVRNAIHTSLRMAAVLNYERISEYAIIEASSGIRTQGIDPAIQRTNQFMHLTELCIEVMKQNDEHHAEAFSWFSDLFVVHVENFWALYQMDLFNLLEQVPDGRWEVFDIFQTLNDYLCNDSNLRNGQFHQHLVSRFAPLVDRYMELMAESIEQAVVMGYQNENWRPTQVRLTDSVPPSTLVNDTGYRRDAAIHRLRNSADSSRVPPGINYLSASRLSQGCSSTVSLEPLHHCNAEEGPVHGRAKEGPGIGQTAADLLWRLYKIKHFVRELNWPQPAKAKLLDESMRVLCAKMLREAVKRTLVELELTVRRCSKTTELVLPLECCTMLNTVMEVRGHLFSLCQADYRTICVPLEANGPAQTVNQLQLETEEFFDGIQRNMLVIVIDQFILVLNTVLNKLTRFDENKLISSLLTLTKPVGDEGRVYSLFLHANLQQLSENLADEVSVIYLCENWYTRQMRVIYEWLVLRKSVLLHPYQTKCLSTMVKKIFSYFELQGLSNKVLDTIAYQTVCQRLQVEEATQCVRQDASGFPGKAGSNRRRLLSTLGGVFASSPLSPSRRN